MDGQLAHQHTSVVVRLSGDIDLAALPAFHALIAAATEAAPHVIIDMGDVDFFDSSGVHVIDEAARRIGPEGSMTIRNPGKLVRHLMDLSGVERVVDFEWTSPGMDRPGT